MKKLRLHIVILTFLSVLVAGVAGREVLYRQQVQKPLDDRFAEIAGVESIELTGRGTQRELIVTLKKEVELDQTYQQIVQSAQSVLGDDFVAIQLVDKRNTRLNDALHASHFAIEEGIATGRFTEMAERVTRILRGHGIDDFRLAVDETNVYLQMVDKENYLFRVFPRQRTTSIAS